MLTTWRFRIKDSAADGRDLTAMARTVNFIWNYAKDTQVTALRRAGYKRVVRPDGSERACVNFLSKYELNVLVSGSSKELGLHSQTVQAVVEEYATRVRQFKKTLRWRSRKSLGWIPFKASGVKLKDDAVFYCGRKFRFWNSRALPEDAETKTGCFSQDRRGRWYVSITFASAMLRAVKGDAELGVDLGIKTLATLSDGGKIPRPDLRERYLRKIRTIERTRRQARRQQAKTRSFGPLPKARQMRNLHAKVAHARSDHLHKESTKLVERAAKLVVGALPCAFMNRNRKLSGISLDNGIGMFKTMLRYKAERAGVAFEEISERNSTQTCSACGWRHPKVDRIGLGVRGWECPGCGAVHDRDVNAAINILRMGHHAPIRAAASAAVT